MNRKLTRRAAVAAIAAGAPVLTAAAAVSHPDAELIGLGRQFEEITATLDREIAGADDDLPALDRLAVVEPRILATPATTMEGMRVKARAACWALGGDLQPTGLTTDVRIARSIVRDLIRLYDPQLEHPGAIAKLIAEIEAGAGQS
jgi:hypothetical protein